MAKRDQKITANGTVEPLQARLNDYSAVARISTAVKNLHRRMGNWPIYAAATGSALAMATGASANNIQTFTYDTSNNSVTPLGSSVASSKQAFFGVGNAHVVIRANSGLSVTANSALSPFAVLSVSGINPMGIFQANGNHQNLRNFAAGDKISSGAGSTALGGRIVNAFFSGSATGDFHAGVTGYAGLAIKTQGGQDFNYGWLKLVFTAVDGLPHTLTALSYGIELTPHMAINAGQISDDAATPEPGTMALALLAAGAAGVMALRRRRQQEV